MWRSLSTWEDKQQEWIKVQFSKIDAKTISEEADAYAKVANRVEKILPSNPIGEKLKLLVDTFRGTMPVVVALRNDDIQESHMLEIKDLLQNDFDIYDENFTLNSLIEMNVVQFQEEIETISTQASQEASLRRQLNNLDELWKKIDLITKPYKKGDMNILDEIDDVFTALDDSLATINTILGSRYVKPLRVEAESWKKNLFILNQVIEEWVVCQRQWIYLENILKSPDIKTYLPNESSRFEKIDSNFKKLMDKTKKSPSAIKMVKGPEGQRLLDQLKDNNKALEEIQKKLEDYLEKKRMIFPRFYFLSNDELLEILANSQNLEVIQQNLKTCFENIYRLDIEEDSLLIKAMNSGEKEKVMFSKKPSARGQVESWLNGVQDAMRETLQKLMKQGVMDFEDPAINRKEWIQTHFGQIVATVSQIVWCYTTEEAINRNEQDGDALTECLDMNKNQLKDLTALVRGKLSSVQRKIIVALVTTDVHARDIVQKLCDTNVCSTSEFEWQKQLRYYWDYEKNDCVIRQVNSVLAYAHEYMGATSRLVITPLTDRCWITITGAIHIKLGANPAGPAGTGKTESTKDLAKAIGVQCIVFNCSDQIDYMMMGRLFSGLAQQGCWTCLDEFNRIDIEVLSVVAQQLATIRQALLLGSEAFLFEGQTIPLVPSVAICVTMNPGYAGRTELPDNLKVLFRPVSMMIPDYGLIAEIMLFAEGFDSATELSKKMVKLYKLASEQLSQQDHYDFGMRAVKSVLVMAGSLKRANPEMKEDAVLIRAMRDSNVPKFLPDDLPLFGAIIQDLFPTVEIIDADYGELQTQIEASIKAKLLQPVPSFVTKVIQLFDTFDVRFGVMIVGPTGAGKTTCYEVLQHAM
jgi:dynein heavy chain